jgi:hypothetical protein
MKMKKLMIAILVLATASVFAGNGNGNGNGNSNVGNQEPIQLDGATFADHVFTINKNGTMTIQFYQSDTTLGQDAVFGYYKSNADGNFDRYLLADQDASTEYPAFTGNESFTIEGLKVGDQVRFFVIPTTNYDELDDFSVMPGHGDSTHGNTVYGVGWDKNDNGHNNHNISFMQTGFTPDSAPSGQPLPGALTTMLIASGCAAYLRKRKAARK